jgi:DNA invertase Pin-like site-specific DNA recombinase
MEDRQRAAGYIRVEDITHQNDGIKAQKQGIEGFARGKGIALQDFYIDNAGPEVKLDQRDGYRKLNNDIISGKVNTVVVTNFDILIADSGEKLGLLHEFAEKGVEIFTAANGEHINPSDPITKEQRLLADAMRETEEIRAYELKESNR